MSAGASRGRLATATGGPNFAEPAFAFRITSVSVMSGLGFALVIGVCGGLLPSRGAPGFPIVSALHQA